MALVNDLYVLLSDDSRICLSFYGVKKKRGKSLSQRQLSAFLMWCLDTGAPLLYIERKVLSSPGGVKISILLILDKVSVLYKVCKMLSLGSNSIEHHHNSGVTPHPSRSHFRR
jgi:hypothetical protein